MSTHETKVTFQPSGRAVYVLPGTLVVEAAARAGITIQTPCGGNGTCGKCRVRFTTELPPVDPASAATLSADDLAAGLRLGCKATITGACTIEIPDDSTFGSSQVLTDHVDGKPIVPEPVTISLPFQLTAPSQADCRPDSQRLLEALEGVAQISPSLLPALPALLRAANWQGRAICHEHTLIALDASDDEPVLGVAIDLGTTTVVAVLLDLLTGVELGIASDINAQVACGDDVLSRIMRAMPPDGRDELQQIASQTINQLIQQACAQAGVPVERVFEVTVAGNSTMQQLLLGIDSSALAELPFVAAFDQLPSLPANHFGLQVADRARLSVLPQIGGFVGGDTVAACLAADLDQRDARILLVDIGTNGEIVLANHGQLEATSTAAGPAFEGARIKHGMRAADGAIEKIMLDEDGDLLVNVIGNLPARGLCGSALIDVVALLLEAGAIEETGALLTADEAAPSVAPALTRRLQELEGEPAFVLVEAASSANGEPIALFQRDVRELQLASGSIRAGIEILLKRAEIGVDELDEVLLAGAFGNFIRRNHAVRIGLLPGIDTSRIRYVGNAALLGARQALLSEPCRIRARRLAERTAHVDLSMDTDFQMAFASAMLFPA
jgi:uncharacterized 2Fe-2S/4Fe-4S cluster protein (DUF4445 family)